MRRFDLTRRVRQPISAAARPGLLARENTTRRLPTLPKQFGWIQRTRRPFSIEVGHGITRGTTKRKSLTTLKQFDSTRTMQRFITGEVWHGCSTAITTTPSPTSLNAFD